jgi:hypothetical protein
VFPKSKVLISVTLGGAAWGGGLTGPGLKPLAFVFDNGLSPFYDTFPLFVEDVRLSLNEPS